jgi:hypothetical protein
MTAAAVAPASAERAFGSRSLVGHTTGVTIVVPSAVLR